MRQVMVVRRMMKESDLNLVLHLQSSGKRINEWRERMELVVGMMKKRRRKEGMRDDVSRGVVRSDLLRCTALILTVIQVLVR